MTFGFKRIEILSAQANGVTLLILAAFITYEAIRRLFDPAHVRGGLMLVVALLGVVVNLVAIWTPRKGQPPEPQRRGQLPARPHRPLRLHRHRDRRGGDPAERLRARGPDRLAADRRADDALGPVAREGLEPRIPRGGADGTGSADDRRDARAPARRRRGSRSACLGNHERLSGALGACARRRPTATATRARRAMEAVLHERLRARSHDAAGRSRRRRPAEDRAARSCRRGPHRARSPLTTSAEPRVTISRAGRE